MYTQINNGAFVITETARQRAPCIIFIDEIDSIGGKRGSSQLHPYANQTINKLLQEIDGYVLSRD